MVSTDVERSSTNGVIADWSAVPATRRRAGAPSLIAALLIGLASLLAVLAMADGGRLPVFTEKQLIQSHLDAWYGGDFDTADSLRAPERIRTGPSDERAREEVAYQSILGARAEVLGCERLPPETVRCDVAYSNALDQAAEDQPVVLAQQFGIRDGLILFVAGPYLEDAELSRSFGEYANRLFPDAYEEACIDGPNYQRPACAHVKLLHLEDWAAWHISGEQGRISDQGPGN